MVKRTHYRTSFQILTSEERVKSQVFRSKKYEKNNNYSVKGIILSKTGYIITNTTVKDNIKRLFLIEGEQIVT